MGIPYKTQRNKAFQTALRLLGPLVFYELCTEAAAWVCSLFGIQDAMAVTGGGAFLALPFLYIAYRRRQTAGIGQMKCELMQSMDPAQHMGKMQSINPAQHVSQVLCADQPQRQRHLRAGCFFAALAGIGACLCLNVLLQVLIPPSDGWNSTREALYGTSLPVRLLVTVLLAPLAEELLFRGLVRAELRCHLEARPAAFLVALLFGLYHGNISQGIYAFLLALCLELVCAWSGLLLPAICLHAGANGAAICLTVLTSGHAAVFNLPGVAFFAAAGAILTAAALYKTKEVFCKS